MSTKKHKPKKQSPPNSPNSSSWKPNFTTIGTTKLDRINIELERLEQRKALKAAELELNTEDARVRAAKLQSLNLETEVLRQQLELQRERAILEEDDGLKGEQQLAGLERTSIKNSKA